MFSDFGIILAPFCSSSARLGCLGGTFGVTWGVLVTLLAPKAALGGHLGALEEHLGSLWKPWGIIWEPLGSIRAHLGGLGGAFGRPRAVKAKKIIEANYFGPLLAPKTTPKWSKNEPKNQ